MEINKTVVDMVSTTSAAATSALALLQRQEGAQPWAETTAATFRESLKALEGIEQVMRQNEQQAAACIDKLHDIAMRGGAPADVVATVDALLLRMRKYRAGG
jgi:hypothetical protein